MHSQHKIHLLCVRRLCHITVNVFLLAKNVLNALICGQCRGWIIVYYQQVRSSSRSIFVISYVLCSKCHYDTNGVKLLESWLYPFRHYTHDLRTVWKIKELRKIILANLLFPSTISQVINVTEFQT